MVADVAKIPLFVKQLLEKRDSLQKELENVNHAISSLDSWYSSALTIVSLPEAQEVVSNNQGLFGQDTQPNSAEQQNSHNEVAETLTGRIISFLDAHPEKSFTPVEVAQAIGVPPDEVNGRTTYLVKNNRISKVTRGLYQSVHSRETAAA